LRFSLKPGGYPFITGGKTTPIATDIIPVDHYRVTMGRRYVLAASAAGSSVAPFLVSATIVALPTIGREFSADAASLGWLTTAFFLAAAMFLVPFGRIADVYGAKKVFMAGSAVYLVSVVLCSIAPDIWFLIGARFITGIGAGMIFGTSIALLSLVFPAEERGKAIGVNVAAMFSGFLLGSIAGGLLTFYTSWRLIYVLTIPVEIMVIWLILSRIRGECELTRHRGLDPVGMLLYSPAIFLVMAGFSTLPRLLGIAVLAAGGGCLALFVFHEVRADHPLVPLRLFRTNRMFLATNLTALVFNTASFAFVFLLSLYLQDIRGYDARVAGLVLLTPILFMAVLSPPAGRLSDRVSPSSVIGAGVLLTSCGLLICTFLDSSSAFPVILAALALLGAGTALFQSPLVRASVSSVEKEMFGLASGMIETMRLIGMTISIAITIIVFTAVIGDTLITPPVFPLFIRSFQLLFWIFLIISLAAFLLALTLKREPGKDS
jgi:MFS family permease